MIDMSFQDMTGENCTIRYTVNGKDQGVAFRFLKKNLQVRYLFPSFHYDFKLKKKPYCKRSMANTPVLPTYIDPKIDMLKLQVLE